MSTTETRSETNGDRFGIKREMGVIPGWAYVLAALIFVTIPFVFLTFVSGFGPGVGGRFFRILFPIVPATILAFLVLMIGYVNRDAGRRGMNRLAWTLIVIFVPNAIGFIIYFLMRNPLRTNCPKCGTVSNMGINYCPSCRYNFHPTCPQCKTAVRTSDTFCANCGVQLNSL